MIESVSEFFTGWGSADALARALGNSRRLLKGVRVKAMSTNTLSVFVGPSTVAVTTGFELDAGDEVFVEIDDPSKISVISSPSQNQKQTVSISGSGAGDTFKLTFKGETTAAIAQNADAAAVESALEALSSVAAADVGVTGGPGPGTDWVVEWTGQYQKVNQPLMTVSEAGRNEKQTVSITSTADNGTFTLTYESQTTVPLDYDAIAADVESALEALSTIGSGNVSVTGGPGPSTDWVVEFVGSLARTDLNALTGDGSGAGRNEKQTVSIDNATTSGHLHLTYEAQTTGEIAHNASAADVKAALEALSTVGSGNVDVTGGPGPTTDWVVEFKGTLGNQDLNPMTGDGTALVGGSTTVTITETQAGVTAVIGVSETQAGNACTVTVTQSQDAGAASQYCWIGQ